MDDLIYTLLFIGWIAYGIYSAIKKNKAKAQTASVSQARSEENKNKVETVLDSLFQEVSQNNAQVNTPYYASNKPEESEEYSDYLEEQEEYEALDYLDTVPEKDVESKIDTYSGTDNAQSSFAPKEETDELRKAAKNNENEDREADAFDLRQAVIAQAILERPYQ